MLKNLENKLTSLTEGKLQILSSPSVALALASVSVWLVIWGVLEYLLTEHWFVTAKLTSTQASLTLVFIMIVTSVLAYLLSWWQKKLPPLYALLVVVLFIASVAGYHQYKNYYQWLQTFPKVKSVSKNWTIQGDGVAIEGKNFGEEWRPGKVWVGDIKYQIVNWHDKRVVVEQPVTTNYQTSTMIICNYRQNCVVVEKSFQIKDPSDVL